MRRPAVAERPGRKRQKRDDAALIRRLGGALPKPSAQSPAHVAAWLAESKAKGRCQGAQNADPGASAGGAASRRHRRRGALSLGPCPSGCHASAWFTRDRSGWRARRAGDGNQTRRRDGALAGRGDAHSAPQQGAIRAADRACRYRRGLAGRTRHRGADRVCRRCARRRRGLSAARGRQSATSSSRRIGAIRERHCGYIVLAMGKMGGGELNFSSDIDLMVFFDADCRKSRPRRRAWPVLRASDARPRQNFAGAHGGRLRVSGRSAAASRSVLDPDRDLDRGGARLLRKPRPELGTRGADQGARLRRRPRRRRKAPARSLALHLAKISRLRDDRRRSRNEAADPCLSRVMARSRSRVTTSSSAAAASARSNSSCRPSSSSPAAGTANCAAAAPLPCWRCLPPTAGSMPPRATN